MSGCPNAARMAWLLARVLASCSAPLGTRYTPPAERVSFLGGFLLTLGGATAEDQFDGPFEVALKISRILAIPLEDALPVNCGCAVTVPFSGASEHPRASSLRNIRTRIPLIQGRPRANGRTNLFPCNSQTGAIASAAQRRPTPGRGGRLYVALRATPSPDSFCLVSRQLFTRPLLGRCCPVRRAPRAVLSPGGLSGE